MLLLAGEMIGCMLPGMLLIRLIPDPVITLALVLGFTLFGCAAPDRVDPAWKYVQLTPTSSGLIDTSTLAVHAIGDQRPLAQEKLDFAGFQVRVGKSVDVIRPTSDEAGFARDLATLSKLFPGAVHLVVLRDGQRVEVSDGILITLRSAEQLPSVLARHHLQIPQSIMGQTVRAVTQPRDDLLHLNERIAALRADPDIVQAEFDLITYPTLK